MKNNKLYTLGVLAATGLVFASAMPVKAATFTGGGKTDVTYTPGESGGSGGDGSLSDWVVKYPKKTELTDKSDKFSGAAKLQFSLQSRDDTSKAYQGKSTVTIKLDTNANKDTSGKYIKLSDGTVQDKVTMGITKFGANDINAPISTNGAGTGGNEDQLGQLTKSTTTAADGNSQKTAYAFLQDISGAKANTNYKAQLSFTFTSTDTVK